MMKKQNQFHLLAWAFLSPLMKLGGDIGMVSVCVSVHPFGVSDHYLESDHSINFKFDLCICWQSVQNWFTFGWSWLNFGPLVTKKMTGNGSKWWFQTIIWKIIHTIQFKLLVCTCYVSVEKLFAFGWRWPNFGPLVATKLLKMVVPTMIWKSTITWNNDYSSYFTLSKRVFTNDSIFCHIGLI